MHFIPYLILLSVCDARGVWALHCYNCMSLDRYNPDCVELKGEGMSNVNRYIIECSEPKNACSLYIGRFEERQNKPRIVVSRKCDYMWDSEPACRGEEGPTDGGKNTGWTCKCTTDFCNWREGVDSMLSKETRSHMETTIFPSRGATFTFTTTPKIALFLLIFWN